MSKIIKYFLLSLLFILVLIQFVPVARTNPPVTSEIQTPDNIKTILKTSCYDCHSNETVWTWYSKVAPASWLVVDDVNEAREEMNFSTWAKYTQKKKNEKLEEIWEEIEEDHMPLWQYVVLHPDAKLSEDDEKTIHDWVLKSVPSDSSMEHENTEHHD